MELLLGGIGTLAAAAFVIWVVSLAKSIQKDRVEAGIEDTASIEAEIGDWLHDQLMERFGLETEAWAIERTGRVESTLNAFRSGHAPVKVEVLWMQEMTAFVGLGDYVYVSR